MSTSLKMKLQPSLLKVASLSMRDAGIEIDDELIVDRSIEAKHEDIVIALIDMSSPLNVS
jgi:DNA polymerase V